MTISQTIHFFRSNLHMPHYAMLAIEKEKKNNSKASNGEISLQHTKIPSSALNVPSGFL